MNQILIFSGTTEGRKLAEDLCKKGIHCTVCVATEYGEMVMEKREGLRICQGRMTVREMRELIQKENYNAVVDATHPFATVVSDNIRSSMTDCRIPYLRLRRQTRNQVIERIHNSREMQISFYPNSNSCAEALTDTSGKILLTTGSKELAIYSSKPWLKERLIVRVLPGIESINLCYEKGLTGRQIIAMQGPFSVEMNEAIMKQYDISCLVTKESGSAGGFLQKIKAAENLNIKVMVIGNPEPDEGLTQTEVYLELEKLTGVNLFEEEKVEISFIGMGMGNPRLLTKEAEEKLKIADVCFGAERLVNSIPWMKEKHSFYLARDIIPWLKEHRVKQAAVLFSGDTGFYSGSEKLREALKDEAEAENGLKSEVFIYPGISSISYLAARLQTSWQEAEIISIHGRAANVAWAVRANKKTFLLVSGVSDVRTLGSLLMAAGMEEVVISLGYQLSYPEEEIITISPAECLTLEKEGLYACMIVNDKAAERVLTHGMADEMFIRDKVPMTKEEIREISICKLGLAKTSVLYDVGSGTGSIAVECARISEDIQVYAIEKKAEAAKLIKVNRAQFGLTNVSVIQGEAPEAFLNLPFPTHAFIGGSSGNMKEILTAIYRKNPGARIVINVITLETLSEVTELLRTLPVRQEEIVQLQVSKASKAGRYHLMKAENPVYVISFFFKEEGQEKV
ncbi:precorrin-6A reductase [Anaerocolumna chitinilytica]|uniref:Tetrapyrrole methylase domain-containing protein n=1 Tax=Anaerocolumna chitinilytica TaxID=1727145 RepID=A0A7I8DLK5_9FIRM|nr:precorrin-6A reductase [Anaerocolumna chitinilytica]BCJ99192.1 hypothetical protein bsdcttw_22330 [Anaerocolumna chitinilytica]